ncbi:hypothetical protein Bca101_090967 [Brassica carinata]
MGKKKLLVVIKPRFSESGQPSLLSIKYHLSSTRLPGEALTNLPTLRSNSSLTVTNSSRSGRVNPSINGVGVNSEALQSPEDSL